MPFGCSARPTVSAWAAAAIRARPSTPDFRASCSGRNPPTSTHYAELLPLEPKSPIQANAHSPLRRGSVYIRRGLPAVYRAAGLGGRQGVWRPRNERRQPGPAAIPADDRRRQDILRRHALDEQSEVVPDRIGGWAFVSPLGTTDAPSANTSTTPQPWRAATCSSSRLGAVCPSVDTRIYFRTPTWPPPR